MRIAILAPISWRVPPRHYGPWEQFASLLTEGLVQRGVDVTLFATADSITHARLASVAPTGYSEDPDLDPKVWESLHIAAVFERADEFDLIHNSFDFLPLSYSRLVETPLLTTIHGFSSERIVAVYERYDPDNHYVAISDSNRHPRLSYAATIHHGIDMASFDVCVAPGDYLLYFGRIHPDKGTAEAIDVARRADMPLMIAGIIQDQDYFERFVAPHVDGTRVSFLGPVGPQRRGALLGGARALLHLIDFEEPFGFSVVESMACGTPVIASARGSMPEIVRDGLDGYLVDSAEAAVSMIEPAGNLDRRAIRESAGSRFGVDRMVDAYLDLYGRIIDQRGAASDACEPVQELREVHRGKAARDVGDAVGDH